jgi:hypothetical protein
MADYQFQAAVYAEELCVLRAGPENIETIDGIFEADLVRSQLTGSVPDRIESRLPPVWAPA